MPIGFRSVYLGTRRLEPARNLAGFVHHRNERWIGRLWRITVAVLLSFSFSVLASGPASATIIFTGDVTPDPTTILPTQDLDVGNTGVGTLDVAGGSTLSNRIGRVGTTTTGNGAVEVSGTGSAWNNSSFLNVGHNGTGTLDVIGGGSVTNADGNIGVTSTATGAVTVSGTGSMWTSSGTLHVGRGGTGTLDILLAGGVSNGNAQVGVESAGNGAVVVNGAGSTWTNSGELWVGWFGDGTLDVTDGGSVTNTIGTIGVFSSSDSSVTVSGAGSSWTSANDIRVGFRGKGALDITDGGTVGNTFGVVGNEIGSTGSATVSGAGSTWNNSTNFYVGNQGNGTLTVENGGVVNVTGDLKLAVSLGRTGTLAFGIGDDGTGTIASGLINVGGTMSAGFGTSIFDLAVGPGISLNLGDMFTLVDYGTLGSGFAFSNIADDALFTTGAFTFLIDYNKPIGTSDFALVATLSAIASAPEPAPAALLALGLAGLVVLRRRRLAA